MVLDYFFAGEKGVNKLYNFIDKPVTFFKEKIVEPNQKKYPWYHQHFRRVPTIDECYMDDPCCRFEAQQQFSRDRMVESGILNILRNRGIECDRWYQHDKKKYCQDYWKVYKEAEAAWFTKYGELGIFPNVLDAFMKQKHRMIWERRHGPITYGPKKD